MQNAALEEFQEILNTWTKMFTCKVIVTLLCLSALVNQYTNLEVMCSSIGLSAIALIGILRFNPKQYPQGLIDFLLERSKGKIIFMLLASILAMNLPYKSLISCLIGLSFLLPQNYAVYTKHRNDQNYFNEDELGILVCLNIIFVQHMAILLKYEGHIDLPWYFILLPLCIITVIAGLILVVYFFVYLTNSQMDDDFDETMEQRIHKGQVNCIYSLGIFLVCLALLGNAYLPDAIYQKILLSSFIVNLLETMTYILFKKSLLAYYNLNFFMNNVMVQTRQNTFESKPSQTLRKSTKQIQGRPLCLFCPQADAQILHESCGRLIFCLSCYKSYNSHKKKRRSFACPFCKQTQGEYYKFFPKDQMGAKLKHACSHLLSAREQIVDNLF